MITIVNNCLQFVELAQLMKQHYWRPGLHDNEAGTKFEALLNTFQVSSLFSLTCRGTYTSNSVSHSTGSVDLSMTNDDGISIDFTCFYHL
jgi:hypothetical protein